MSAKGYPSREVHEERWRHAGIGLKFGPDHRLKRGKEEDVMAFQSVTSQKERMGSSNDDLFWLSCQMLV